MNLQEKILKCNDLELDKIITLEIKKINLKAKKIKLLGYIKNSEFTPPHKGFIHMDTKISPNILTEPYSIKTTDYFYEFARYIRNNNITSNYHLYCSILHFSISYFFNMNNNTTFESFLRLSKMNDLGDFKHKNTAACCEYSILAQNLLSLFGFESYICFGYLTGNQKENPVPLPHAYNILKSENKYYLVDYMNPIDVYKDGKKVNYWLFEGSIPKKDLSDFLSGKISKEFNEYNIVEDNLEYKRELTNEKRKYFCLKIKDAIKSDNKKLILKK